MRRDKWQNGCCAVLVLLGVAFGSQVLAQPSGSATEPEAEAEEESQQRRFDVGISMHVPVGEFAPARYGGWFAVGAGQMRLYGDCWKEHYGTEQYRGDLDKYGATTLSSCQVALARYYQIEHSLQPHIFIGAGYLGMQHETCEGVGVTSADRECRRDYEGKAVMVVGAGVDVVIGRGVFARVQARGFTVPRSEYQLANLALSVASHVFVGVGIRF